LVAQDSQQCADRYRTVRMPPFTLLVDNSQRKTCTGIPGSGCRMHAIKHASDPAHVPTTQQRVRRLSEAQAEDCYL
jgi:hypothetical protein